MCEGREVSELCLGDQGGSGPKKPNPGIVPAVSVQISHEKQEKAKYRLLVSRPELQHWAHPEGGLDPRHRLSQGEASEETKRLSSDRGRC